MCTTLLQPSAAEAADGPGIAAGMDHMLVRTPLQRLILLLQGGESSVIADAGIAGLSPSRLEALVRSAREEAEACRERAALMLHLVEIGLEHGACYPMGDVLRTSQHVARLLQDEQRWCDLADSAQYYRDHPEIASRLSAVESEAGTDAGN